MKIGLAMTFCASHFLEDVEKCERLHGHSYKVFVEISGSVGGKGVEKGMVINFTRVKGWLKEITDDLDHRMLNFVVPLKPTAENIARYIGFQLLCKLSEFKYHVGRKVKLETIRIWESENSYVECTDFDAPWLGLVREENEKERCNKLSQKAKAQWDNPEKRKRIENGIKFAMAQLSEQERQRRKLRMIVDNPMFKRENIEKMMVSLSKTVKIKPNGPESKLIRYCKEDKVPLEYVGDGRLVVGGKCPDFIYTKGRKLVELFGRFWHSDDNAWYNVKNDEKSRIEFFRKFGYETLVIWDSELKNKSEVMKKIKEFLAR